MEITTILWISIVLTLYFILLSPGVLLTLPPNFKTCGYNPFMRLFLVDKMFGGCSTSFYAVIVHSLVFFVIIFGSLYVILKDYEKQYTPEAVIKNKRKL